MFSVERMLCFSCGAQCSSEVVVHLYEAGLFNTWTLTERKYIAYYDSNILNGEYDFESIELYITCYALACQTKSTQKMQLETILHFAQSAPNLQYIYLSVLTPNVLYLGEKIINIHHFYPGQGQCLVGHEVGTQCWFLNRYFTVYLIKSFFHSFSISMSLPFCQIVIYVNLHLVSLIQASIQPAILTNSLYLLLFWLFLGHTKMQPLRKDSKPSLLNSWGII